MVYLMRFRRFILRKLVRFNPVWAIKYFPEILAFERPKWMFKHYPQLLMKFNLKAWYLLSIAKGSITI